MNLKHLEMMRVLLERVAAGSWEPTQEFKPFELKVDGYQPQRAVKMHNFNLAHWVNGRGMVKNAQGEEVCGFSACAVGHACFDEEFRKLGWSWAEFSVPMYKGLEAWDGVQKFFGIKDGTDDLLFQDGAYQTKATAKMVADRVQELMTLGEPKFLEKYKNLLDSM